LRALPGIGDAAVLALGQGAERTLTAAVSASENAQVSWRAALGLSLPSFMVPERFLVLPKLPVTANGKADRRALAALLERESSAVPAFGGPLANPQELLLGELWSELFPGQDLDGLSDFFLMGGHSLLAVRLAALLEKRLGWRPALADLMAARTLGAMAKLLESGPASGQSQDIPKAPGPDYPLSSGQARLWMLARLHPDSAAYNVPLALELAGELDVEALQRALTALEERQHALRLQLTPAPDDAAGIRQRLVPAGGLTLRLRDCSEAADPRAEATALMETEALRPFRLERQTPVRAQLLRLGERRWVLLLVLHHAVCDAWSLPILWRELGARPSFQVPYPPMLRPVR
jgi:hypothetical protein